MSDPASLQNLTDFAEQLAREAGDLIQQERDQNTLRTDYKQQTELVTHADVLADKLITGAIRERFPEHRILSEETMPDLSQAENLDTPLWIIDPIDGTVNYAYGHPQVAVSIAYAENGRVQAGVVHAPLGKLSFTDEQLVENANTLIGEVLRAKPAAAKGKYVKSVSMSSTMGPGVRIDPLTLGAAEAVA